MSFRFDRCPEEMEDADLARHRDLHRDAVIGMHPDACSGCPSWGPDCGSIWTLDGRELTEAERDAEHRHRSACGSKGFYHG